MAVSPFEGGLFQKESERPTPSQLGLAHAATNFQNRCLKKIHGYCLGRAQPLSNLCLAIYITFSPQNTRRLGDGKHLQECVFLWEPLLGLLERPKKKITTPWVGEKNNCFSPTNPTKRGLRLPRHNLARGGGGAIFCPLSRFRVVGGLQDLRRALLDAGAADRGVPGLRGAGARRRRTDVFRAHARSEKRKARGREEVRASVVWHQFFFPLLFGGCPTPKIKMVFPTKGSLYCPGSLNN